MSLWCPVCVAPIPEHAARCGVCGGDPRAATADSAPGAEADASRLAPRLGEATETGKAPTNTTRWRAPGSLARALGLLAAALLVVAVLLALALAVSAAGMAGIAWPALLGIAVAALLAGLLQLLRVRRRYALLARGAAQTPSPDDLALMHLFAGHFAAPATSGETFLPPLAARPVRAEDAAWRAIGATLLDLSEQGIVELEPRSLPTPGKPVTALGVRLVRPAPTGDAFAARLLRPLARRGVGASTLLSDLVAQQALVRRQPARALLASARDQLTAQGYYTVAGNAWLGAALLDAPPPDPARIAAARSALESLRTRLTAWDDDDPSLIATIQHEARAGFIRARARAR